MAIQYQAKYYPFAGNRVWAHRWARFFFVLIIQYSLYLEYDSPLIPSASGLAG